MSLASLKQWRSRILQASIAEVHTTDSALDCWAAIYVFFHLIRTAKATRYGPLLTMGARAY